MKRGPHSSTEDHPIPGVLLDWLDGRLQGAAAGHVTRHVRSCAACRSEVEQWSSLLGDFKREREEAPPEALVHWAESLPGALGKRASRPTLLRLVADSWAGFLEGLAQAATPGFAPQVRSSDIPQRLGRRRLLFSAGGFDLDLEIDYVSHEDPRRIHGQILPADGPRQMWADARIELKTGRRVLARARVDRRGEFKIPRIPAGRYRIQVIGPAESASLAVEV